MIITLHIQSTINMHPLIVYAKGRPILRIEFQPDAGHLLLNALKAISEIVQADSKEEDPTATTVDKICSYFAIFPGRLVVKSILHQDDFSTSDRHHIINEEGITILEPERTTLEDCTE